MDRSQAVFSEWGAVSMVDSEIDVARIVNFDSFRAYRWLVSIAEPNPKLFAFLRKKGVDLNHVFNLLGGAIALCPHSFSGPNGPKEDCIFLPVMDEDGVTPLDVVMFSMANPARFSTMLGLGSVLGLDQVFNPATYWGGEPCRLLSNAAGMAGRRVSRAAPLCSILRASSRSSTGRRAISRLWTKTTLMSWSIWARSIPSGSWCRCGGLHDQRQYVPYQAEEPTGPAISMQSALPEQGHHRSCGQIRSSWSGSTPLTSVLSRNGWWTGFCRHVGSV